jgi:phosphoglucosamine mutase
MSGQRLFGTDGIRSVANREPLTADTAVRLGRALGLFCRQQRERPQIVLGTDTRRSGGMLASALAAGLSSTGADVRLGGILPTPAVAYWTRLTRADAGLVVSASHNPFADNGIKIFAADGFKLPDAAEAAVEELVGAAGGGPTGAGIGTVDSAPGVGEHYGAHLRAGLPPGRPLAGLKVALDCAHGAAFRIAPAVWSDLGAEVVTIGVEPDGVNINQEVGAVAPARLQREVVSSGAALGVALDGDADRAILVDERGELADGDEQLFLLALEMLRTERLRHRTVVATVMSNLGLELALQEHGVGLRRVPVGDRHVVEEMRRGGYNLGGEQSGHLVLLDHSTTGDGLLAGLTVAQVLCAERRPLSDLIRALRRFPQVLRNVPVRGHCDLAHNAAVAAAIAGAQKRLGRYGRVLVRFSGTEPLLRIMVEGEDDEVIEREAATLEEAIVRELGAEGPQ